MKGRSNGIMQVVSVVVLGICVVVALIGALVSVGVIK